MFRYEEFSLPRPLLSNAFLRLGPLKAVVLLCIEMKLYDGTSDPLHAGMTVRHLQNNRHCYA